MAWKDEIQHVVVLMLENQSFDRLLGFVRLDDASQRIDGVDAHRRQTDFVPLVDTVFRIDALAVDAYLALPQQPVDPASGHGLEVPHEEIVDSLAGLIGRHRMQGHGTLRRV